MPLAVHFNRAFLSRIQPTRIHRHSAKSIQSLERSIHTPHQKGPLNVVDWNQSPLHWSSALDRIQEWDNKEKRHCLVGLHTTPCSVLESIDTLPLRMRLCHYWATADTPTVGILSGQEHVNMAFWMNSAIRIATPDSSLSLHSLANSLQGCTFALSRLLEGSAMGRYLILTGTTLKGLDLVCAGLATHYIPSDRLDNLVDRLVNIDQFHLHGLDLAVEDYAGNAPTVSEWNTFAGLNHEIRELITSCFQYTQLPDIIASLESKNTETALLLSQHVSRLPEAQYLLNIYNYACNHDFVSTMEYEFESELKRMGLLSGQVARHVMSRGDITVSLSLTSARTFQSFIHRTITGLPSDEDVCKVVTGQVGGGSMALTVEELQHWFASNWGTFLDEETLCPVSPFMIHHHTKMPLTKYVGIEPLPQEPLTWRRHERDMWALRQRINAVVERKCRLIDSIYLKWNY